jgi:LPS-assembly protein
MLAVWALPLAVIAAPAPEEPVYIEAEEMFYDQAQSLVVASGSVEVVQGARIVRSDKLSYHQPTDTVTATGNVSVLETNGNVYFADSVELKDAMKKGIVQDFKARMADGSLFAAERAERPDAQHTNLTKAVYSPCKLCEGDPESTPLWQIKAEEVAIDEAEQRVQYRNAFLEVHGVPVLYTPYLSHITPGADRKSGFLKPTYRVSSRLGTSIRAPYYWSIAPNKDATLTPILTTEEGGILAGEFRHLTESGQYSFEGSVTAPRERDAVSGDKLPGHEIRGHIEGHGLFSLSPSWNWGFDGKHASDDTYLRRYDFGHEDTLTSRLYAEGIKGRGYAEVQGLYFQGLNIEDDPAQTPFALPMADLAYESEPGWLGGRWFASGNMLALRRDIGNDMNRLSATTGWRLPYVTESGHVLEAAAEVRSDAYRVSDNLTEHTLTRFIPQATLSWRYPLMTAGDGYALTVEPVVEAVASPTDSNDSRIPNEDSLNLEFNTANLFSTNRFTGYDVLETGPRANYGIRTALHTNRYGLLSFDLGQQYRMEADPAYSFSSDRTGLVSDYVGRIGYASAHLNLDYRLRLEQESLTPLRNELSAWMSAGPVELATSYVRFNNDVTLADHEEVFGQTNLHLSDRWMLSLDGRRDLSDEGSLISIGSGLIFHNECLQVTTGLRREYTRDRDVEPETSVTVELSLKNIND